ncbi:MAG: methionyl-tRNA formyltransferase [Phycisphaerales bacterium]|nr:methionyl-tRNA formyltransferase [Phycisphaerales bacterium]
MKLTYFGTGEFAVAPLKALHESGHEIIVAVSQPDRPVGRGQSVAPTAVHAAADSLGIRHIQAQDVNAIPTRDLIDSAELCVVVAFGQKIGAELLRAPPRGFINIHGSLLPKYRGAAPIQWAVINGEIETGVTIFQLNEKWDAGPIWSMRATPVGALETADELHDRLSLIGAHLLIETLHAYSTGALQPQVQDASQSTRARKLTRADSALDWALPAKQVVNRIHGLWSWPTATCVLASRSERVQFARACVVDDAPPTHENPPGIILADGVVQTGAGRIRLMEVRPSGGKVMSWPAFANGRRISSPDHWLPIADNEPSTSR